MAKFKCHCSSGRRRAGDCDRARASREGGGRGRRREDRRRCGSDGRSRNGGAGGREEAEAEEGEDDAVHRRQEDGRLRRVLMSGQRTSNIASEVCGAR